jgi:transposase-like protein
VKHTAYQVIDRNESKALAEFLASEGQFLLPMVDLIVQAELAVDEVIDVVGRAAIEAILLMSAEQIAGSKQQGKATDNRDVGWHGSQNGVIALSERKLRVRKPRLRRKEAGKDTGAGGEVAIPAYETMRETPRLGERMLEIVLAGVSTRRYKQVLPEMAETVGVSKSSVSRDSIEAGERLLAELAERRFDDIDLLVIWIDGIVMATHHVIAAVGVDSAGDKHVLGLREGASENTEVVKSLVEELVERGVKPGRRRLFVIDGAKALRKAIDQVYGSDNPVQRCRNHKMQNVLGHLPKDEHDQVRSAMRAAFKLEGDEGVKKLDQLASWLEREHPSAAASLREGLDELFTINRLGLPSALRRCLGTTNVIDSTHSGVRQRTRRVTNWRDGQMALRWAAASFAVTEQNYRKIMGHEQLWMLEAHLNEQEISQQRKKAG